MPAQPMTAPNLIERAAALKVGVVQIADNLPLAGCSADRLDELLGLAQLLGIEIEVGTRGIGYDHIGRYVQVAQRLKSKILRVVVDTSDHHPDPDEAVDLIRAVLPLLSEAGVCLAIENHDRFTARTLVQIVERTASDHVGICLDTVNSFGALEGPEVVLEVLGPWVVNLHVKDFIIRRADHMMGFTIEGRPAGHGELNIPWLIEKLHVQGRDPNAILELWPPPEGSIAGTVAKEEQWVATSVQYLRTLIPG